MEDWSKSFSQKGFTVVHCGTVITSSLGLKGPMMTRFWDSRKQSAVDAAKPFGTFQRNAKCQTVSTRWGGKNNRFYFHIMSFSRYSPLLCKLGTLKKNKNKEKNTSIANRIETFFKYPTKWRLISSLFIRIEEFNLKQVWIQVHLYIALCDRQSESSLTYQQQFFSKPRSSRRSYKTNYWNSWGRALYWVTNPSSRKENNLNPGPPESCALTTRPPRVQLVQSRLLIHSILLLLFVPSQGVSLALLVFSFVGCITVPTVTLATLSGASVVSHLITRMNITDVCHNEDVSNTFNKAGLSECRQPGHFIVGFKTTSGGHKVSKIVQFKWCKMADGRFFRCLADDVLSSSLLKCNCMRTSRKGWHEKKCFLERERCLLTGG